MAGVTPKPREAVADQPDAEPTLEQRVATLETLVKAQTWFIHELMGAVKGIITTQTLAQMQPQLQAQAQQQEAAIRAQIAARLSKGLAPNL